jgi:predicted transcriptional regulator
MNTAIFWDVAPCNLAIALMMEAVSTSQTSASSYQTTQRIMPEDSHLLSSSSLVNSVTTLNFS